MIRYQYPNSQNKIFTYALNCPKKDKLKYKSSLGKKIPKKY